MDALVTRESRNTDLWWHLSTGALIVRHYQLPSADAYSLNGANKIWVDYNWQFGLTLHGSYLWLGFLGDHAIPGGDSYCNRTGVLPSSWRGLSETGQIALPKSLHPEASRSSIREH